MGIPTEPLKLAIAGALGRMGSTIASLADSDRERFSVVGLTERPGHASLGRPTLVGGDDAGGPILTDDIGKATAAAKAWIDFTSPTATLNALGALSPDRTSAVVIGTTGFSPEELAQLQSFGDRFAVVYSGNYSLGIALLTKLVEQAAASLQDDWDIEVFEAHHRRKVDAPSGTGLMLGTAAAQGRGRPLDELRLDPYDGADAERRFGGIGFAVSRMGDIPGDHSVSFGSDEEVLTLSHRALNRQVFARGALTAAEWASRQSPGFYSIKDVLGL